MSRYTFVGTRRLELLPANQVRLLVAAAQQAVDSGEVLRSTGTSGVEQKAVEAALAAGGPVELLLRWPAFEQRWVSQLQRQYPAQVRITHFDPVQHRAWLAEVLRLLPATARAARAVQKQYACLYGSLVEAERLIMLPYLRMELLPSPAGRASGQTRNGGAVAVAGADVHLHRGSMEVPLQLAKALGLEYLDLSVPLDQQVLQEWVSAGASQGGS